MPHLVKTWPAYYFITTTKNYWGNSSCWHLFYISYCIYSENILHKLRTCNIWAGSIFPFAETQWCHDSLCTTINWRINSSHSYNITVKCWLNTRRHKPYLPFLSIVWSIKKLTSSGTNLQNSQMPSLLIRWWNIKTPTRKSSTTVLFKSWNTICWFVSL
jgi:hypothetical protein